MNDRVWLAALVYPAPLYVGLVAFFRLWGGSLPMLAGFVVTLGFGTVTAVGLLRHPAVVAGGRVVFAVLVIVLLPPIGYGGAAADFSAGILLASAFLWLEYVWRAGSNPGDRLVALQMTFFLGILNLAAANAVASGTGGAGLYSGLDTVISAQVQGVGAVVTGGTPGSMPLEATLNVYFAALAALAIAGLLMAWFVPKTAREEPLPWSWARARPSLDASPGAPAADLGLRDGQRDALASRTVSTPPESVVTPGFLSVLFAASVVVAFVALAFAMPAIALGTLVLGVLAAIVLVGLLLSRRLTPVGGLEG